MGAYHSVPRRPETIHEEHLLAGYVILYGKTDFFVHKYRYSHSNKRRFMNKLVKRGHAIVTRRYSDGRDYNLTREYADTLRCRYAKRYARK